jgi:hypothetical protein
MELNLDSTYIHSNNARRVVSLAQVSLVANQNQHHAVQLLALRTEMRHQHAEYIVRIWMFAQIMSGI